MLTHTHTFSDTWTSNDTHHWKVATCEHTTIKKDKDHHSFSDGICSVCGKEEKSDYINTPTEILTEEEWKTCFNYFANTNANYTVKRYSAYEYYTRDNSTFFIDGDNYHRINTDNDIYCKKIGENQYIHLTATADGNTYKILSSFNHDGDGDFIGYSNIANYFSYFTYDSERGVYTFNSNEDGTKLLMDVSIRNNKLNYLFLSADGMNLIYEFYNYGTTTATLPEIEFDENYIYERNEDSTWKIVSYIKLESDMVISSSYKGGAVTIIGEKAFYNANTITTVTIPSSIKTIENYAFASSSIKAVNLTEGITYIGDYAFQTSLLTKINLPNSLTFVSNSAFYFNSNAEFNVKDNIKYLGNDTNPYIYAYSTTISNITSITLSSECKFVARYAFPTTSLTEINVEAGNQYLTSYNGALFNYDKTKLLVVPCAVTGEFIIPSTVKSLDPHTFSNSSYTTIILPDTLEYIGEYCFSSSAITSIVLGNSLTSIEESTFSYCYQLTRVTIGDNISIIKRDAFDHCSSLREVIFSDKGNLKTIEIYAFDECTALETLILPEGLETLGSRFASSCENLKYLSVPNSLTNVDSGTFSYLYNLEYNISNNVAYIGNSENPYLVAHDWKGFGEHNCIVIEDSCKFISSHAFEIEDAIHTIVIGKNIIDIADGAFVGCIGIREIYNLSNLDLTIGDDSYGQIAKYAVVIHDDLNDESILKQTNDGFKYYFINDNYYVYRYVGEATNLVFPDSINSQKYIITMGVLLGNETVESIYIPSGIQLEPCAFCESEFLKSVTIAEGITTIPDYAFQNCENLTIINLPNYITTIGNFAFFNCS